MIAARPSIQLPMLSRASRARLPAAVLPAMIWAGLLFGALDSGYGSGLVCLCAAVLLSWQLWLNLPSRRFCVAVAPAFVAIAAAIAWAALASLGVPSSGGALTPDLAWHGLIGATGYALMLLLACLVGYTRRSIAGVLGWLLVFGTLNIAFGLILYATRVEPLFDFWDLARSDRFLGTVDNANVAGSLCGVCAILAAAKLLVRRPAAPGTWLSARRGRALGCTVALVLATIGMALTASRSGVVLFCLGLLCLTCSTQSAAVTAIRPRIGILLTLAAAVTVLLTTAILDRLINRFTILEQGSQGRWEMWGHYGALAWEAPWLGYGFGSFPSLNARYPGGIDVAGRLWMVNSPHDIALHLLLTAGLPYLVLLVVAAALIAKRIIAARGQGGAEIDRVAAVIGAGILLGSSLVDLALEMPGTAALFLTLVGLVWGASLRTVQRS